ncbi:hypothetical protein [Paludisphaera rhizosphaerae]|uniref:hypothetical protein n=1 Tax=Paludisphaera rhizosphaerae TaxID=2711216 RepID=UPI0013EC03C6|nr:hypothetical protein [Paludisphaera rhizosphaerae]
MVRHESTVGNGNDVNRVTFLRFLEAYLEVKRTMEAAEEMMLADCCMGPEITLAGHSLTVACRIAAGRPAWKRFDKEHVVEIGGWRVILTPDEGRDGWGYENLDVEPIESGADQEEDRTQDRPLVASYRQPRTNQELARLVELAILDGTGRTPSGGLESDGAVFSVELEREKEATVVAVMPALLWEAMRGRRGWGDQTPYWLDAEEVALIESQRAASRPQGGASGAVGPRFSPAAN